MKNMKSLVVATVCTLCVTLLLTSCSSKSFEEPSYKEFQLSFNTQEGQSQVCCYGDAEMAVFAVRTPDSSTSAQAKTTSGTKYLITYDYNNQQVIETFSLNTNADIEKAVPHQEGVVYIDYELAKDGEQEVYNWKLVFMDRSGMEILKEGTCERAYMLPMLTKVDNTPIMVWQETQALTAEAEADAEATETAEATVATEEPTYYVGKVIEEKLEEVHKSKEEQLHRYDIATNGSQYCFLVQREDSTYPTLVIGDADGIISQKPLDGRVLSYGITKDYALCFLVNDQGEEKRLERLEIASDEKQTIEMTRLLYGITGLQDNSILASYSDNTLIHMDVTTGETVSVAMPESFSGNTYTSRFIPIARGKCLARFTLPTGPEYYIVEAR